MDLSNIQIKHEHSFQQLHERHLNAAQQKATAAAKALIWPLIKGNLLNLDSGS